ncbi:MAG: histidinol-phosphatase [Gemmatimonadota bacterium]
MTLEPAKLGELAASWAQEAGRLTLGYFGGRVDAEAKGDGSPVTRADREAETLLRNRIRQRFPTHGILGEEFGEDQAGADIRWILDPIDGTRSFARGVPLYGVLIGVEAEGQPLVGVIHFPALSETVWAAKGQGCIWNGKPCRVSPETKLERSLVLTTDEEAFRQRADAPGWAALGREANMVRSWGDCYGHALVATGRAEVMVDPVLSAWDSAPLLTILTEAGGTFTSLGGDITHLGGSGISTNGQLHRQVLELLATR